MSAAVAAGALLTKSNEYYVLERREKGLTDIIELPDDILTDMGMDIRMINILGKLKNSSLINKDIIDQFIEDDSKLTRKMVEYSSRKLREKGLVTCVKEGRTK